MTKDPNDKELTEWEERKLRMYKDAARAAAKEATREVLESLGFTLEDLDQAQRDQAFVRRLRLTSEAVGLKTVTSAIALMFTIIGAAATLTVGKLLGN